MSLPIFSSDEVASQFGLGQARNPAVFAARGQNNLHGVWKFETQRGPVAIKCYEQPPRAQAIALELAAFHAGIPMPEPLATVAGKHIYVSAQQPALWLRVFEWVDGDALAFGITDASYAAYVGRLLAHIHAIPCPAALLSPEPDELPKAADWWDLADRAKQKAIPWACTLREHLPAVLSQTEFVRAATHLEVAHVASQRDYHPPNLLHRTDGRHALIDWDAAGPAHAQSDVAYYAFVWATTESGHIDAACLRAFVHAYRDAGGLFLSGADADFAAGTRSFLNWLAFNLRRDLAGVTLSDPLLSHALLHAIPEFSEQAHAQKARLLASSL